MAPSSPPVLVVVYENAFALFCDVEVPFVGVEIGVMMDRNFEDILAVQDCRCFSMDGFTGG